MPTLFIIVLCLSLPAPTLITNVDAFLSSSSARCYQHLLFPPTSSLSQLSLSPLQLTCLINHFIQEFKQRGEHWYVVTLYDSFFNTDILLDLSTNTCTLRHLRTACECDMRTLSSVPQTPFKIDSLFDQIDLYTFPTRTHFPAAFRSLSRRSFMTSRWTRPTKSFLLAVPPAS